MDCGYFTYKKEIYVNITQIYLKYFFKSKTVAIHINVRMSWRTYVQCIYKLGLIYGRNFGLKVLHAHTKETSEWALQTHIEEYANIYYIYIYDYFCVYVEWRRNAFVLLEIWINFLLLLKWD